MKNKGKILMSAISAALTVLLIILLRFVDVREIGPKGTSIGLSHLNQFFFNSTGVNMVWYDITDWLGLTAVATAFIFAVVGLVQFIKRKSFIKVDKEILALGGLYLFVIGIYLLFENMIVNYRPVIMPGSDFPGASFPSSHTMIVCIIMGSAMMVMKKYIKKKALQKILTALCCAIIAVTIIGRLISGVHWFTDIIGGILISVSLLTAFSLIINRGEDKK